MKYKSIDKIKKVNMTDTLVFQADNDLSIEDYHKAMELLQKQFKCKIILMSGLTFIGEKRT